MTLEHPWDLESVNFPLNENSVVFEIGGYEGRWSVEIARRFNPNIYVFEPQPWAFKKCVEAMKPYSNARVFDFALGAENGEFPMGQWETDGCSFFHIQDGKPCGSGVMQRFDDFLKVEGIPRIDLCLMNIEGYELVLLPYMLRKRILNRIHFFMCQFHTFSDKDDALYYDLRRAIGLRKRLRFDYGKVLTCWESK